VLPAAIAAEDSGSPDVVRLTKNAPALTAGQKRGPSIRSAASAIPEGGQTALALALTKATDRPAFPATK
jgi:hypothetical protein